MLYQPYQHLTKSRLNLIRALTGTPVKMSWNNATDTFRLTGDLRYAIAPRRLSAADLPSLWGFHNYSS